MKFISAALGENTLKAWNKEHLFPRAHRGLVLFIAAGETLGWLNSGLTLINLDSNFISRNKL